MLSKAVHEAQQRYGYMTASTLAQKCGVHRTTVSEAIRLGKLKAMRIGNVSLISNRDAASFSAQYKLVKKTTVKKKSART